MTQCSDRHVLHGIGKQFEALGTKNHITVYDSLDEKLLENAVNRVLDIDDKMSAFKKSSEISNINQNAGRCSTKVSDETLELFDLAGKVSEVSQGAFDITIGPLVRLWGIGKRGSFVPAGAEIEKSRKLVDYRDVITDRTNKTVYLNRPGQAVDLGGIAKGYAADEVKRILMQGKVNSAVINLGGNIITIGKRPDGSPWRIGIQNPLAPTGEHVGSISVESKTVVTSGSNERFFMKNGTRYHHILDPRTGNPAQSGLLSVTVVCNRSVVADALTTALFILGMEKGMALLKTFEAEAVFLTEEGHIYVSEGLKDNYQNRVSE